MIVTLFVISFLAITAYCLVVAWPRLKLSQAATRQQRALRPRTRVVRSLYDMSDNKRTECPRLLKR